MTRLQTSPGVALAAPIVSAHHSSVAIYDSSRPVEVAGIVEEISWRNTHGQLRLLAADGAIWEAEMSVAPYECLEPEWN